MLAKTKRKFRFTAISIALVSDILTQSCLILFSSEADNWYKFLIFSTY